MTIGERIKQLRKAKGYSADTLAEKLHLSRSTIFRYENGDIEKVPSDFISDLATILDTTPAAIMGWEPVDTINATSKKQGKTENGPQRYTSKDIAEAKEYVQFFDKKTNGYFTGSYNFDTLSPDEIIQFANEFKRFEYIRDNKLLNRKTKK